ncbi:MAG: hypothetical protein WKF85_05410 [Chitinophagaceae bacterium]
MTIQSFLAKPSATGTFWGIIGGISLIIITISTTNGYLQIVPYFFILSAAVLTNKYIDKSNANFLDLFKSGLFAFVISSVFLYAYILTVVNPNSGITFLGHMWRFGAIVGMGMICSSIISFLAKPVK